MSFIRSAFISALVFVAVKVRAAEEKPAKTNQPPTITMALPFAIGPGTNKIIVRGLNITNATAVRFVKSNETAMAKILSRSKAALPDKADPKKLGDVQLELLLTIPDASTRDLPFVVTTPEGDSNTNTLRVVAGAIIDEKEPNGSLKKPQLFEAAQFMRGVIDPANDVDVFSFTGKRGQKFRIATASARYGSTLDPILTVYDSEAHLLATSDDADEKDAALTFIAPKDGTYSVSIIDAHDRAGIGNTYLLEVVKLR
jgi:hypothetical protein